MLYEIMEYQNDRLENVTIYAHDEKELLVINNIDTCEIKSISDLKNGLYMVLDYIVSDHVEYIYSMKEWLFKVMHEELQEGYYLSNNEHLQKALIKYIENYL